MGRLLLAVLVVLAGCVSHTTPTPFKGPVPVRQLERFRVFGGEQLLGHLVLSEIAGQRYYRVVTPTGGWVGDIHEYGRFFKCVPFEERPREIGLFTMNKGLGLLFESGDPIHVLPMEGRGAATEAAAHGLLKKILAVDPKK